MTLANWSAMYHQTVFNGSQYPYVILHDYPNQLPSGAISVLYNLSDYTVEPNVGGAESVPKLWFRKAVNQ